MRPRTLLPYITLGAVVLATPTSAAPKAAVVYCSWGNYAFRDEFDPHLQALGWPFEKFENTRIADLMARLDEFDVVISAGVGNYENPVDMAPYKDDWLRFLERGGLLLITDASYGTVLDLWVNRLGPDYALTTTMCASHKRDKPDPDRVTYSPDSALLHVPDELQPLLAAKGTIWAHLESWDPAWTSLATCADDKSLFLYRDVGKGCLAVTSYFSFRGPVATPLVSALLGNLWLQTQGLRNGVALTQFDIGEALPGARRLTLRFRSTFPNLARYQMKIMSAAADGVFATVSVPSVTVRVGSEALMETDYGNSQRGNRAFHIEISRDDRLVLALERAHVIPPVVSLRLANRHLYPWQKELAVAAGFVPEANVPLEECVGQVLVDGQPAARVTDLKPSADLKVDVAALQPGEHKLLLRLNHGDAVLGEAEAPFSTHATPRVHARPEDGTTMVEGKPFFPFGWYHVSWSFTTEERLEFLRTVAAGGFNTVHAGIKQIDEWDAFLAEAEKLQVRVVTEYGTDPLPVIRRYRDRWAVLAWNPGDEPDGGGVDPAVMLERHNAFKDADPEHPSYMTLCVPSAYARYVAAAEIIAPDPYPIRHAPSSTEPVHSILTQAHNEAWKLGRPIWGILQCFGYQDPNSWRVPTFAECRNMTYLALLAGVKGIIYYTFADPGFSIREHPDLWRDMCTLPAELSALEPWLMNGRLTTLETGSKDLFAGVWTVDGRNVICVVSTANEGEREARLALPPGIQGEARPLFAGGPTGLTLQDGKLTGKLAALEVHVYEIR